MDDLPFAASEPVPGQPPAPADEEPHTARPAIDIEALAEKVYRLMLAEIRLDRARGLASDNGG